MLSLALLALPLLAAAATIHDVQVGADGLSFTPEALSANPGDVVSFHFVAKNHTASQSSFASPCGQLAGGFDSGFMPVAAGSTNFPTFNYTVTSTSPVWVHCKQAADTPASHCGAGMVFAINCPTDSNAPNSFSNFKASALAIGAQLSAAASAGTPAATPPGYGAAPAPAQTPAPAAPAPAAPAPAAPAPASDSSGSSGTVHVVSVGGSGTLTYSPSNVAANPGDIISFQFMSKNHTATQSTFASPCTKIETTNPGTIGFDSGFQFIANGSAPTVWNITVNDTTPIWVYCRQKTPTSHCGAGMVFAVNSNETEGSTKTFNIFQSAAMAQGANTSAASAGNASTSGSPATPTGAAATTRISSGLALGVVGVVFALVL